MAEEELQYRKKTVEIELCQYDMLVVFNCAELLVPRKRKYLDKLLKKIPSRVIKVEV